MISRKGVCNPEKHRERQKADTVALVAELVEQAIKHLLATNGPIAAENLNLGFPVVEELDLPSLARHGNENHNRSLTISGDGGVYLGFRQSV